MPIVDAATGEMHPAQIFVAVLGASNYTFAEAHPSQDIASWIQGHVHAFQAFRGVPAAIVPDNLKAGFGNDSLNFGPLDHKTGKSADQL